MPSCPQPLPKVRTPPAASLLGSPLKVPSHGSASLPLFSTLLDWFLLKDVSQFISMFLGSCNSSRVQEMLQVLGFFRTDSAPWQDLGSTARKPPCSWSCCLCRLFCKGERTCAYRGLLWEKKNKKQKNISPSQKDVFLAETSMALS